MTAARSPWWDEAERFVAAEREGGLSDYGFLALLCQRMPVDMTPPEEDTDD